jgi:hypothetical protein
MSNECVFSTVEFIPWEGFAVGCIIGGIFSIG